MSRSAILRACVVFGIAWAALPAAVLADDCSSWSPGEVASCPNYAMLKVLGFLGGALLTAAAALRAARSSSTRPLPPEELDAAKQQLANQDEPPPDAPLTPSPNYYTQNAAYDPGGTNVGGGPSNPN